MVERCGAHLPMMNPPTPPALTADDDPWLWLEEVQGDTALDWVRARNAESRARLEAFPGFAELRQRIREVLDAHDRIPGITRRGEHLYNFWQDATQPRGLWRRTTLAQFRQPLPAWDTLLDLDALGREEGENWVWGGATCLGPDYRRCLLSLSRGGADAHVLREFDLSTRRFVEGGFTVPEAKSEVAWADADTLYLGSDFGPGSLTDSGYPRVIKRWRRGQPLAEAETVFEGLSSDVGVGMAVDLTPGHERSSAACRISSPAKTLSGRTGDCSRCPSRPTPSWASGTARCCWPCAATGRWTAAPGRVAAC
jgi:prolyl oligopeptidase